MRFLPFVLAVTLPVLLVSPLPVPEEEVSSSSQELEPFQWQVAVLGNATEAIVGEPEEDRLESLLLENAPLSPDEVLPSAADKRMADHTTHGEIQEKITDQLAGIDENVTDQLAELEEQVTVVLASVEEKVSEHLAEIEDQFTDQLALVEKQVIEDLADMDETGEKPKDQTVMRKRGAITEADREIFGDLLEFLRLIFENKDKDPSISYVKEDKIEVKEDAKNIDKTEEVLQKRHTKGNSGEVTEKVNPSEGDYIVENSTEFMAAEGNEGPAIDYVIIEGQHASDEHSHEETDKETDEQTDEQNDEETHKETDVVVSSVTMN